MFILRKRLDLALVIRKKASVLGHYFDQVATALQRVSTSNRSYQYPAEQMHKSVIPTGVGGVKKILQIKENDLFN